MDYIVNRERVPAVGYEWTMRVYLTKREFVRMIISWLKGHRPFFTFRYQMTDMAIARMKYDEGKIQM